MPYVKIDVEYVRINQNNFIVKVADTKEALEKGLSGVESMPQHHGMLFVLEEEDLWDFWMKDMLFPLDIIFIDSNWKIVAIHEDAPVSTGDHFIYSSSEPYQYALEFNQGTVARCGIKVGDKVVY